MFKATILNHREAIDVASAAREFKEEVQAAITAVLAPLSREGESLPQLAQLQELVARLLEQTGGEALEVDQRYTNQLVNSAALRQQRNALMAQLRKDIRHVRYLLDNSVGSAVVKATLRERRVSVIRPELLVGAARDLVKTLRDPDLALENLADKDFFANVEQSAAKLEDGANRLQEALMRLSPQKKASERGLKAKVTGIDDATEKNRRCADLLFGLYRLAGLDFHAERLRPKARRRRAEEPEKAQPPAAPPPLGSLSVN